MCNKPLISVIIPVYNRELYIERCINSILLQQYENFEIIIVDDGSTDLTANVCRKMEKHDSRIVFVSKKNEGSGYARNKGMELAKGEYWIFMDSDDYLLPDALARFQEIAELERADIVCCLYLKGKREKYLKTINKKKYQIYSMKESFEERQIGINVWGKFFRRGIIETIRFPKETLFDDEFFTYKVLYNAEKIVLLHEAYVYIYLSKKSIMRSPKKNVPIKIFEAYDERLQFFSDKGEKELVEVTYRELALRILTLLIHINEYQDGEKVESLLKERFIESYLIGVKRMKFGKEKIALYLFFRYPLFAKTLLKFLI